MVMVKCNKRIQCDVWFPLNKLWRLSYCIFDADIGGFRCRIAFHLLSYPCERCEYIKFKGLPHTYIAIFKLKYSGFLHIYSI